MASQTQVGRERGGAGLFSVDETLLIGAFLHLDSRFVVVANRPTKTAALNNANLAQMKQRDAFACHAIRKETLRRLEAEWDCCH